MHPDEANQAVRTGRLLEEGEYKYDPREFHGPSLYWLTLPSLWLSGAKKFAETNEAEYRAVPALFGAGLVLLLCLVVDGLGRGPAVAAAVFLAVSPAMVFYSRYYIQEMLLVFFTFAAIACGWRYFRSRSLGWAVAAGGCVGLMHATKETWILAAAAAGAALGFCVAWAWLAAGSKTERDQVTRTVCGYLRPGPLLAAGVAACLVATLFYSSFGGNWAGPLDSILAYGTYLRRGSETGMHTQPWYHYLQLLVYNHPGRGFFWSEGLIVGLAVAGGCLACGSRVGEKSGEKEEAEPESAPAEGRKGGQTPDILRQLEARQATSGSRSPSPGDFVRFLAVYTLVLTVLYAAIPYKTPWCLVSFLHGMTLLAGVAAWTMVRGPETTATGALVDLDPRDFSDEPRGPVPVSSGPVRRMAPWPLRLAAGFFLAVGILHLGWETWELNFNPRLFADQRNPYVYAHTSSDVLNLAAQMERLADVSPEGHDMVIHIVTPENYWPIPWYLRRFRRAGYWQDPETWQKNTGGYSPPSVILLTSDVQEYLDARLPAVYNKQAIYGLRPGVPILMYVREDLWQAFVGQVAAQQIR